MTGIQGGGRLSGKPTDTWLLISGVSSLVDILASAVSFHKACHVSPQCVKPASCTPLSLLLPCLLLLWRPVVRMIGVQPLWFALHKPSSLPSPAFSSIELGVCWGGFAQRSWISRPKMRVAYLSPKILCRNVWVRSMLADLCISCCSVTACKQGSMPYVLPVLGWYTNYGPIVSSLSHHVWRPSRLSPAKASFVYVLYIFTLSHSHDIVCL